jgi:hypothetical protein
MHDVLHLTNQHAFTNIIGELTDSRVTDLVTTFHFSDYV